MTKNAMYLTVGAAAIVAVGVIYYVNKRGSFATTPAGSVTAASKATPGTPTTAKGSNVYDFGASIFASAASAYTAYAKSGSGTTAAAGG